MTNRISLIGNDAIKELAKEINRRFNEDCRLNNNYSDTSQVGRLLFGLSGDAAYLSDKLDAKWVHIDGGLDEDEPLRLISGWRPVFEIQNQILECASKLDPHVIVYMEYDDEMPNFIGVSYVTLKKGDIIEFNMQKDLSSWLVAYDGDYDEAFNENLTSKEHEEVLRWEEVWELMGDMRAEAFATQC
ncbi:hypothetical protein [Polynucleobacter sp. AP-Nickl1-40-C4]|uniref:hypothetical protein n=1 Tax=Polynucleobacter sp. AP-Nickl1-40-C4 TaxID=3108275 RepID=UPI002B222E68|nr:hypothetical protein [Polynucleobacter sp. AP-Nickl1-40-C4]MEA9569125.1 hypothetical protein [Polynucleobacter sp. AP-Nickl1-40-C4]